MGILSKIIHTIVFCSSIVLHCFFTLISSQKVHTSEFVHKMVNERPAAGIRSDYYQNRTRCRRTKANVRTYPDASGKTAPSPSGRDAPPSESQRQSRKAWDATPTPSKHLPGASTAVENP